MYSIFPLSTLSVHCVLCCLSQPFYALEAINPDRRVQLLRPLLDGLRRQAAALVLRLEGSKPSVSSGFATLTAYYVLVPLISNKAVGLLREVACRESITSVRVEPLLLPGLGVCEPRLGRPTRDERLPGPLDEEVEDSLVGVVPTLDGGVDHRMAVYGGYVRRLDEMIARYKHRAQCLERHTSFSPLTKAAQAHICIFQKNSSPWETST